MRHRDNKRKFGRVRKVRVAFLRSLAEALLLRGKMKTTEARAREIRPYAEKLITLGKNPTVARRRLLISKLGTAYRAQAAITAAERFKNRAGGYTRIVKLPRRPSDGSPMAIIEFV